MRRATIVTVAVIAAVSAMTITVFAAKRCSSIQAHCVVAVNGNCEVSADRTTAMTQVIRRLFSAVAFRTS